MKTSNNIPKSSDAPVPHWYGALEVSPGRWFPPLAAGMTVRSKKISIVVLRHKSFEPAYVQEIPLEDGMKAVNASFADAVGRLSDFNLRLCCATEPHHQFELEEKNRANSPWFWVRYPHRVTCDVYDKTSYLAEAWDKHHYFALALATQLQEDFNMLQDFDCEVRRLLTIGDSIQAMTKIVTARLPKDMDQVINVRHDLSF